MGNELTRVRVKSIFTNALNRVANFNIQDPALEQNNFINFMGFHKIVLLNEIKSLFLNTTFIKNGKNYCYDITLNENMFSEWDTFKDCIDYLFENQLIMKREANVNF